MLLISALFSDSPLTALLGRAPRSEGALVLAVYLLAGLSGARLLGPGRSARAVQLALKTMAWCVIVVAGVAVLESLGARPLSSNLDRPGSLLGNASDQGAFAVLYGGPLVVAAIKDRGASVITGGAVAAVLATVLSGSRGAMLGLAAALVVIAVLSARRSRWAVGGVLLGAAALVLAVPATRDRVLGGTPWAGKTITGRGLLWRESLSLLSEHPILGVGPSQFQNAIAGQHDLKWQQTVGPVNPPGSPHNVLLQAVSAGGVLLLVVMLILAGLAVRNGVRIARGGDHVWGVGLLAGL
jgi:O-antigen ligase